MHSADYAVARCPSVRLSVTRRYSVETAKHILKLFSPSGSHIIPVFFVPNGMTTFRRRHPYEKKSRFVTNISLYLGNYTR